MAMAGNVAIHKEPAAFRDHETPLGCRRLRAKADERQSGRREDDTPNVERCLHQNGRDGVRDKVARQDYRVRASGVTLSDAGNRPAGEEPFPAKPLAVR